MAQPLTKAVASEKANKLIPWTMVIIGYMFMAIFRPFEVWPELGAIRLELLYALVLIGSFCLVSKNNGIHSKLNGTLIIFFLLSFLSQFYSPYPWISKGHFGEYWKVFLIYVVFLYGIRTRAELEWSLLGYIGVLFVYEFYSLIEYGNGKHMYRMGIIRMVGVDGLYNDPNAFAATIACSFPYVAMFVKYRTQVFPPFYVRLAASTLFVLGCVCIVLTGSRTGMISIVLFFCLEGMVSKYRVRFGIAGIIMLAVGWTYMPADMRQRLESTWNPEAAHTEGANESASSRWDGVVDGYKLMMEKPLLGYGAQTFRVARDHVGKYGGLGAHNLFGKLMGEFGMTGVLVFFIYIVLVMSYCTRVRKLSQRIDYEPNQKFYQYLGFAVGNSILLLLFFGVSSHNLFRYTWLWYAAFIQLGMFFILAELKIGRDGKPLNFWSNSETEDYTKNRNDTSNSSTANSSNSQVSNQPSSYR